MDPLPHYPRNFRECVEADLRRAARVIIQVQHEMDPQFRIATPLGDYWLAVMLPSDEKQRAAMLARVLSLMAWKQAISFTIASKLVEPDVVYCVGIALHERHACLSRIRPGPKPWTKANFGPVEWLPDAAIGDEVPALLPRGTVTFTDAEMVDLQSWFGARGKCPVVHIATGWIGA
jgi:hypothetical protein